MQRVFPRIFLFSWLDSYEYVQQGIVILLYLQILCGLVGSLGALYTGIVLANLVVALFALVAIASGYESLGRAYAACLAVLLALDFVWFLFFSDEIWALHRDSPIRGWAGLSVLLTFYSECVSCGLRVLSAFLWCQMYRLGTATDEHMQYPAMDYENGAGGSPWGASGSSPLRGGGGSSMSDEVLGATIYNPHAYSTLFENTKQTYFGGERPENSSLTENEGILPKKDHKGDHKSDKASSAPEVRQGGEIHEALHVSRSLF